MSEASKENNKLDPWHRCRMSPKFPKLWSFEPPKSADEDFNKSMIFAMKSCASFFLCPRSVILRRVATWSMGLGGVRCGNLWSLEEDVCSSMKELTSNGRCFLLNIYFAYLVYLYLSSPGFFLGSQADHYLTATFFRVFPSIRCAKEVERLKNKEIEVANLKTASFNSSWICQRHNCRTYATRLVLVVLCLEAWQWTKWSLKSNLWCVFLWTTFLGSFIPALLDDQVV